MANDPQYNKPDAPGIAMNFDNTVSLYQIVGADETFDEAAAEAFSLLREAQEKYPDWPRVFYLDIEGHKGPQSGFDADFFEFQQEFWFQTIAHFVTAFDTIDINSSHQISFSHPGTMIVNSEFFASLILFTTS